MMKIRDQKLKTGLIYYIAWLSNRVSCLTPLSIWYDPLSRKLDLFSLEEYGDKREKYGKQVNQDLLQAKLDFSHKL